MFGDLRVETEKLIACENQVVAIIRLGGTTRQRLDSDVRYAQLVTLRDGRLVRVKDYSDPREALEAVGLSE